jgi:alpha-glucosidase (family GH31 glycosyl hydrolase)
VDYWELPYFPGKRFLHDKSLSMDAYHYQNFTEYNVHNYFGLLESQATYDYLKERGGQGLPFIVTRSNAPGSGLFTTHWGGDNEAS